MKRGFVLIDRDGTLIVEKNYLSDPGQIELIPGSGEALARLRGEGWGLCVLTNQSGIARGYFDMTQLESIHRRLEQMLVERGVTLDGIYVCPHAPQDGCKCRKPLPGLFHQAMAAHGFTPDQAWVIGDKPADIGMGHAAGARSILVRTGYGAQHAPHTDADYVAEDLPEAVSLILRAAALDVARPMRFFDFDGKAETPG